MCLKGKKERKVTESLRIRTIDKQKGSKKLYVCAIARFSMSQYWVAALVINNKKDGQIPDPNPDLPTID